MLNLGNYIITTGTFDPPTRKGHLNNLVQAHKITGKKIMVLPNYNPGHKKPFASFTERVSMLKKLFKQHPFIHVRTFQKRVDSKLRQLTNQSAQYTEMYKMIIKENKLLPGQRLGLLTGEDNAANVLKSLKENNMLKKIKLYVTKRPGYELSDEIIKQYREVGAEIKILPEVSDASSSVVRKSITEGTTFKKISILSKSVAKYMTKHHLYKKLIK
ncbi:MAG: adenylyltransferase/cytidyltransferase family protein [bacterium]